MKTYKAFTALCLASALLLTLLAGCAGRPHEWSRNYQGEGPGAFSYSDGLDENGFWAGVRALDYIEMFDYQALPIPNEIHYISDSDVQYEINYILDEFELSPYARVTGRAVLDGDEVNIDYVGTIDGVEFSNGSTEGEGADVTIGVTPYIDGFLEQLIGHMPGETVHVEVTFPDDYHTPDLRGKDALFVTAINYILESALTDDLVADNLSAFYGWTTVDEMNRMLRADMQKYYIQQYLNDYLAAEVPVLSVPDPLMEYQVRAMLFDYQEYADSNGMELEELLVTTGVSGVGELIENNYDSNLARATFYLVTQAVAESEDLSVGDGDLEAFFGSSDYSIYEERFGLPFLKQAVLCQKVLDWITEHAVLL